MAKQTARPTTSKPAAAAGPAPYPSNWGKMTREERAEWMRKNRPGRNTAAPVPATGEAPPPRPSREPPLAPPESEPADQEPADQEYDQEHEPYTVSHEPGSIVISAAALSSMDPRQVLVHLFRSLADALDDIGE